MSPTELYAIRVAGFLGRLTGKLVVWGLAGVFLGLVTAALVILILPYNGQFEIFGVTPLEFLPWAIGLSFLAYGLLRKS
jgi:hypothetical protein